MASNPLITTAMTYNYTELDEDYYDCDTFPYQEYVGSADSGGGSSSSSYDSEYLAVNGTEPEEDQPTEDDSQPQDSEEEKEEDDRNLLEKAADKIMDLIDRDDEEGATQDEDGRNFLGKVRDWLNGLGSKSKKTIATYVVAGVGALVLLWFFWKQMFAVAGWLLKNLFKAVIFIFELMFKLMAPIVGIIIGFAMTPLGLVVIAILAAAAFVVFKLMTL